MNIRIVQSLFSKKRPLLLGLAVSMSIFAPVVHAQPYGKGYYGDLVPYGSETTLSITTSSNVTMQVTPTDNATLGTGDGVVTVETTDTMGFTVYIQALGSTDLTNGGAVIPASSNTIYGPLATNTWGYNVANLPGEFMGIKLTNEWINGFSCPCVGPTDTFVTYGVMIDNNKPAGNYTTGVVYTAAPQTD